jgi:hypothetical protein
VRNCHSQINSFQDIGNPFHFQRDLLGNG